MHHSTSIETSFRLKVHLVIFPPIIIGGGTRPVLRSLRHAPESLILEGKITPAKMHTTSLDIDRLCDLFNSKAKVSKSAAKVNLVPSHETAYKGVDVAALQLNAAFEEAKSDAPTASSRPRRTIRKDGLTTSATSNRRSSRFSSKK